MGSLGLEWLSSPWFTLKFHHPYPSNRALDLVVGGGYERLVVGRITPKKIMCHKFVLITVKINRNSPSLKSFFFLNQGGAVLDGNF